MKIGSLVRCTWQPANSAAHLGYAEPMKYVIKGRMGIISTIRDKHTCFICFPEIAYTHCLAHSAFEVICEGR